MQTPKTLMLDFWDIYMVGLLPPSVQKSPIVCKPSTSGIKTIHNCCPFIILCVSFVQSGVERTKELVNCCGCGSTVEESITVGLPKQGYVPGESIYLTGQVDNRDREESCDFHAKFMQV